MTSVPTSGGASARQRGLRLDPDEPRVLHVEGDVDVLDVLRLAEARGSDRLSGSPLMALEASRVQPMFDLVDVGAAL